jgi:TIR domain/CHAT domain
MTIKTASRHWGEPGKMPKRSISKFETQSGRSKFITRLHPNSKSNRNFDREINCMKKIILVITSNPQGTTSLRLDRELRVIDEVIQKSQFRDRFDVHQLWAARTIDLIDALLKYQPRIVHFCGHGEGQMGLVLEDEAGNAKPVSSEALAEVFKNLAAKVECVLLNACYSEVQANAIVEHINYVIGMSREIRDDAAIAFTRGFYTALGNGEPIKNAYNFGKSQVAIEISSDLTAGSRKFTPIENLESGTVDSEYLIPRFFQKEPLTIFDSDILQSSPSKTEQSISGDFLYDAYICYVDREPDRLWVWDTLVPRLERAGIEVAVSGDVDIPGVPKIVNIEQGIRQAKRTVIVLSDAYLTDNMAEFEHTLGQTMGIQEGTYRLLPIESMPFDRSRLPTRLSMLTTLDLSNPRRIDREFDRLLQALKQPLPQMG